MDISKFSFAEMVSNNSGKTSASGTMGCLICVTGCLTFLFGSLTKHVEILTQSVIVIGLGAGLLGYKKSRPDTAIETPAEEPVKEERKETDTEINDVRKDPAI